MTIHFNKAKHLYQKSEKKSFENDNAMNIIKAMVKELRKSMDFVMYNMKNDEQRLKKNKHFSKALVIIYTLQTSLDFDSGGNLANKLFQLYEYCRQQLINDFRKKINDGIKKAINALDEIFTLNDDGDVQDVK